MIQDNDINVARQLALLKDRRDRILYTYKAHEKAADKIDQIERWRKRASIVLTAVSATTFLASLGGAIGNAQATNLIISFIALLATAVSLASDSFDLPNESKNHAAAARELRPIFQEYEAVVVDLEAGALTLTEAIERRNQLAERENQALKGISVRTTRKNYENASKALETDERVFNEPASEAKDRQD